MKQFNLPRSVRSQMPRGIKEEIISVTRSKFLVPILILICCCTFQDSLLWQSGDPVAFQQWGNEKHQDPDMTYWIQALSGGKDCQYFPSKISYGFKAKSIKYYLNNNKSSLSGAQRSSACGVMVLRNLAEPWWVMMDCSMKLAKTLYCFIENRGKGTHEEHDMPEATVCPSNSLHFNTECLTFVWWNRQIKMKTYKPFLINDFVFLFDAVSEQFPPIFSADQSHIFTYKRCSDTYKLKSDPIVSNSTTALIMQTTLSQKGTTGGNIFRCQNKAYILSTLVCDATEDCPGASDESGCECDKTKNYSSKCKFLTDKSGKQSCSKFYMTTASNHCHIFTPKANGKYKEEGQNQSLCSECKNGIDLLQKWKEGNNAIHWCTSSGKLLCNIGELKCYLPSEICLFKLNAGGFLVPCSAGGHIGNCTSFQCNMMYKCPAFYCVPWGYVCDNKWDCPGGNDEHATKCEEEQSCAHLFKCRTTNRCVHFGDVCNGQKDCPSGDDEQFCSLHEKSCPPLCQCLLLSLKCDNVTFLSAMSLTHQIFWIEYCLFNISSIYLNLDDAVFVTVLNTNLNDVCQAGFNVPSLVSLDVTSNKIVSIVHECFQGSVNLKIVQLPKNLIHRIEHDAFKNLTVLLLLNLTGNFLTELKSNLFSVFSSISILSLNATHLTHINTQVFKRFHLQILETQDTFLCCLISENTHCTVKVPWFESCSGLIPTKAIQITFYCISLFVLTLSVLSLTVERQVFVKKLEKVGAYRVIVGAIDVSDIIGAVPLFCLWIADLHYKEKLRGCARQWQSSALCHYIFSVTLLFNIYLPW